MNTSEHKHTNHLIHQTSPYLLQHAHNPVNWYPWGEEVLNKAKKENKLIIISIGYSACHWCHVMEHESFEDEEVASFMNENFVAVKVDREERPDIDQVYTLMNFKDKNSAMFNYTSDIDPPLVARKLEVSDNVIPSSNSEMAKNLYILGKYLYNEEFIAQAKEMLNSVKQNTISGAAYYANWDILMAWFAKDPFEVAIVGNDFVAKRKEFDRYYLPNVFLSGGKDEGSLSLLKNKLVKGSTTIYVCQDKDCKFPVKDVDEALLQIND